MPHIVVYVNDAGLDAIKAQFQPDYRVVESAIEEVVAETFNKIAGESLVPGETATHDHGHISKTMPVDISVVVLAWVTDDRVWYAARLQEEIQRRIRALFTLSTDLKIQIFLNIVGDITSRS